MIWYKREGDDAPKPVKGNRSSGVSLAMRVTDFADYPPVGSKATRKGDHPRRPVVTRTAIGTYTLPLFLISTYIQKKAVLRPSSVCLFRISYTVTDI